VAGALTIFDIAGQLAAQHFFLVEQAENKDGDDMSAPAGIATNEPRAKGVQSQTAAMAEYMG